MNINEVVLIRVDNIQPTKPNDPRHYPPPIDLLYIKEGLQQLKIKNKLIDCYIEPIEIENLSNSIGKEFNLAIIKGMSSSLNESIELGNMLKNKNLITIAVGQFTAHKSHYSNEIWKSSFDITILGEPEEITPKLVQEIAKVGLNEVAKKYNLLAKNMVKFSVTEPNKLPQITYENIDLNKYPFPFPVRGSYIKKWGHIISAWGCPHESKCKFCSPIVRKSIGNKIRSKDPKKIITEIKNLKSLGVEGICFEDDSFFGNKNHIKNLCLEMINQNIKIPWIASVRIDDIDEEILNLASKTGAVLLKIGIESGSSEIAQAIGKSVKKIPWRQLVIKNSKLLKKYNIGVVGLFMIGLPNETEQNILESIELAKLTKPDYIQVQIFTMYPDTIYFQSLNDDERKRFKTQENIYHYGLSNNDVHSHSFKKILSFQNYFYKKYYLNYTFIVHHVRYMWRWYLNYNMTKRVFNIILFKLIKSND